MKGTLADKGKPLSASARNRIEALSCKRSAAMYYVHHYGRFDMSIIFGRMRRWHLMTSILLMQGVRIFYDNHDVEMGS